MADSLDTMNPSRRTVISSGIAAAGALAATSLPAYAIEHQSDEKLLRLCRNWHRLWRAFGRAIHLQSLAEEAQGPYPPKPAILLEDFEVWPGDQQYRARVDLYASDRGDSDRIPYLHRGELSMIARGRLSVEAGHLPGGTRGDETLMSPPKAAREHAQACLDALDQWQAACKASDAEADERSAISERFGDRCDELAEMIAELPSQNMAGVNAKLAIVRMEPNTAEDRGITASVLRDVARIDLGARLSRPSDA
jgi:hypothetical protein